MLRDTSPAYQVWKGKLFIAIGAIITLGALALGCVNTVQLLVGVHTTGRIQAHEYKTMVVEYRMGAIRDCLSVEAASRVRSVGRSVWPASVAAGRNS